MKDKIKTKMNKLYTAYDSLRDCEWCIFIVAKTSREARKLAFNSGDLQDVSYIHTAAELVHKGAWFPNEFEVIGDGLIYIDGISKQYEWDDVVEILKKQNRYKKIEKEIEEYDEV